MKICALQLQVLSGDREANMENAARLIAQAMHDSPDVLVLPELWDIGYPAAIRALGDPDGRTAQAFLSAQSRRYGVNIVGGSIVRESDGLLWNTAYVYDRQGVQQAAYDKVHLFSFTGEQHVFAPGDHAARYALDGVPAASLTCYDIRFGEWARVQALNGCAVLFVPALWAYPRLNHWRLMIQARAVENQMFVVGVNAVGNDEALTFCGHSLIVDPWGDLLAEADDTPSLISATIDPAAVQAVRSTIKVYDDRRPELYGPLTTLPDPS